MMNLSKIRIRVCLILSIFFFSMTSVNADLPQWYQHYEDGLKAMAQNDWIGALKHFQESVKVKNEDSKKMRAFGTIFIEYFAHREMGICYYYLGHVDKAKEKLLLSMQQASSDRTRDYLNRINRGDYPTTATAIPSLEKEKEPSSKTSQKSTTFSEPKTDTEKPTIVGERLSIAVLPFESKGLGNEIGEVDLLDKLITGFVNCKRFKVIERAQLEKILDEQKLGMTGIIDASTAAEIGRGIGVDAVVLGSVTRARNSISIDARVIDTGTATIVTAQDAYSNRMSFQEISEMISNLADKISRDLPIVNGYVINIDGEKLTLDIGRSDGIKRGMRCLVYREGDSIIHPVSGEVIGKMIEEICELQVTYVAGGYSIAEVTKYKIDRPKKLDKVITK